jgi:membrane protease YdiL (CAAX protease family)
MSDDNKMLAPPPVEAPPEPPAFGARAALKVLFAFLGVQVAVVAVVGVVVAVRVVRAGGASAGADAFRVDIRLALAAASIGALLGATVALGMVRRAFARPGGDAVRAAVGWAPASRRDVVRGALTGLALGGALLVLGAVTGPPEIGPLTRAIAAGGVARLLWSALAVLIAPPSEELVFRGVLYAGLTRSWGRAPAAVTTTVVFAALHAAEIGWYWPGWLVIGALGALALRARVAARSLVPAIALHASYNLALVLLAYAR